MQPHERKIVRQVMRTCFGWFASLFFDFGSIAYVYELDGRIVGGTTISKFRIDDERSGGVVKWIFTLPEARGRGAASQLLDAAMQWFAEQQCHAVFACIEGYNTASSNRFSSRGFSIMSLREQLSRYGLQTARIWMHTVYGVTIGHFLWARVSGDAAGGAIPAPAPERSEATATGGSLDRQATPVHATRADQLLTFGVTALFHAVFAWLLVLRTGGALTVEVVVTFLVLIPALFGIRLLAMKLAASMKGLSTEYRPWDAGMLLSLVVHVLFGGIMPAPGTLYPKEQVYRYRDELPRLGFMAFAGAAELLGAGWILLLLLRSGVLPFADALPLQVALTYIRVFLIFDVLIPIFPFECFNGKRILDWNRLVWVVCVAATIALWLV
ncbi:MAG: GNAT family N-acetyltransferase [Spirochaetaceae bacterium]|nr:MAG: GNAT family N-acetyltransferase [Spirochaetaceae bacterium]